MKKFLLTIYCSSLCLFGLNAQKINAGKLGAAATATKAFLITDEDVAALAAKAVIRMDTDNPVCSLTDSDPKMKAYAKRLDKIFSPYKNYDGLNLNYKVYYVIDINAFACPDGSIRVFSSLMDLMTDDEILGVIGHEIGHVKLGHSKKAYKQAILTSAAGEYLASTNGSLTNLPDSELGKLAGALMDAQFSQKQESAADDYGYKFMVSNGKNPEALASAFRKLAQLEKEAGNGSSSKVAKMFSSHPDSEKRAKKIEDKIKKDSKK